MVSSCECGDEPPGSVNCGEFLELAKKLLASQGLFPWSYVVSDNHHHHHQYRRVIVIKIPHLVSIYSYVSEYSLSGRTEEYRENSLSG